MAFTKKIYLSSQTSVIDFIKDFKSETKGKNVLIDQTIYGQIDDSCDSKEIISENELEEKFLFSYDKDETKVTVLKQNNKIIIQEVSVKEKNLIGPVIKKGSNIEFVSYNYNPEKITCQ